MSSTSDLNFGPQWLRDSCFQDSNSAGGGRGGGLAMGAGYNVASTKMAAMKLADFRYGREEMLALFDAAIDKKDAEEWNEPPEGTLDRCPSAVANALWMAKVQTPLNLQGSMSEEEQRVWARGANSDQSLRSYKKEAGGMMPGEMVRGGMGGPRGRGRGRGFDRHRSVNEDEEREMMMAGGGPERGRGRGAGEEIRWELKSNLIP